MDTENNLNQFSQADYFRAPSNFEIDGVETCSLCGEQIKVNETIVEQSEGQFMHMKCVEWHIEDMQGGL